MALPCSCTAMSQDAGVLTCARVVWCTSYISLCVQALSTARKGLLNRNHPASIAARLRDDNNVVTKRDRDRWLKKTPFFLRLAQSLAALFVSVAVYVGCAPCAPGRTACVVPQRRSVPGQGQRSWRKRTRWR